MTNEVYEVAISEDGVTYGPFEAFVPGDVRLLGNFVKFRVTVFGDFGTDEYRQRGFAGIVDDATTVTGGFGLTPFGRYPFGDGGICLESSEGDFSGTLSLSGDLQLNFPNTVFHGSIMMSGELSVSVSEVEAGSLSMSGDLVKVVPTFETLAGALSMSGSLATQVTQPAQAALVGWASGGTPNFTGTRYASPTTALAFGSSIAAVEIEIPIGIFITGLLLETASPLGVTTTLTGKIVVNGVTDNSIVVSMTTGDQIKQASGGAIAVNANDKFTVELVAANNNVSLNHVIVTYQAQ